jgi:hypothetical protein
MGKFLLSILFSFLGVLGSSAQVSADSLTDQLINTVKLGEPPDRPFDFNKFQSLLAQGADVNGRDKSGQSVLMLTVVSHAYLADDHPDKVPLLQAIRILAKLAIQTKSYEEFIAALENNDLPTIKLKSDEMELLKGGAAPISFGSQLFGIIGHTKAATYAADAAGKVFRAKGFVPAITEANQVLFKDVSRQAGVASKIVANSKKGFVKAIQEATGYIPWFN